MGCESFGWQRHVDCVTLNNDPQKRGLWKGENLFFRCFKPSADGKTPVKCQSVEFQSVSERKKESSCAAFEWMMYVQEMLWHLLVHSWKI